MIIANKKVTLSAVDKMAYLLDKERKVAPRLLRGDRDLVCKIYDNSPHKYDRNKLVETVISFERGFIPTEEQKKEELDLFEKRWLLENGRVNYIAVEHNEKNNYHIHIIINKLDLLTGAVFNPFPPGHIQELKDYVATRNDALGLKQVERKRLSNYQRPTYQKDTKDDIQKNGFSKQEKKKSIDEVLQNLVRDGKLKNRAELIHHLREQGYQIPRIGNNYISIEMEQGQNIRLKGGIYSEEFTYKQLLGVEKQTFDIDKTKQRVNEQIQKRSEYNVKRFGTKQAKPMFKINMIYNVADLNIKYEEREEVKKLAKENNCSLRYLSDLKTWELKTKNEIPLAFEKFIIKSSVRKSVEELFIEDKKQKREKSSADDEKNSSKNSQSNRNDFKVSTSEKPMNMSQHKDTTEKTSQNSFKQAVFTDDDKNNDSLSMDNAPGPTGTETISAQIAVNKARSALNSARTPRDFINALHRLLMAQHQLEQALAQLEQQRIRNLNKIK